MASLSWEGDRARIVYRDASGKQKSLRLGKCRERDAATALNAVEHLMTAKSHGSAMHPDAVRWLGGLDDRIYARVAAHGLCQPRQGTVVVTLAQLLDRFDATLTVKPTTRSRYKGVAESLRATLGAATPLASVTPAHADRWRKAIAEPVTDPDDKTAPAKTPARASVANRTVIAKGIFRKAVRWQLIASSPFDHLRAGSQSNPDRAFYVTVETIRAVLAACPDNEWRAVIGLSRFAGLRVPSEIVGLRWADILWDKGRMVVKSPKTANHEGHAVRIVPIAPELRSILQDLFDRAEVGVEAVLPRLRERNLRTQFERIIAKAGVKPWPRLTHNLRASCATDWVERFPSHVVASWLGHSPMIAATFYLQTRDAHFDLAAGIGETAANAATEARPRETTRDQAEAGSPDANTQNPSFPPELVGVGVGCDSVETKADQPGTSREEATECGFHRETSGVRESRGSISGSNPHGAPLTSQPDDRILAALVAAWPELPKHIRDSIARLVRTATKP
jgi:integrase